MKLSTAHFFATILVLLSLFILPTYGNQEEERTISSNSQYTKRRKAPPGIPGSSMPINHKPKKIEPLHPKLARFVRHVSPQDHSDHAAPTTLLPVALKQRTNTVVESRQPPPASLKIKRDDGFDLPMMMLVVIVVGAVGAVVVLVLVTRLISRQRSQGKL
ncbi:hypothetical protein HYFRA_00005615 [Hymenoscyphus fraxineus]|uniref:Transmembrane protein n=1 Tax=Hymenoscyphus fraxineus TaxID=746836 RepID=A0A9N9KRJ9_9HELO|nr:hypothetical protein HYFRA_00005615 [Hymenoscyphus fraxineus]